MARVRRSRSSLGPGWVRSCGRIVPGPYSWTRTRAKNPWRVRPHAVGAGVVLRQRPQRRSLVLDDDALRAPLGEDPRRVVVAVLAALRQVDLDHVVRRTCCQLRPLLRRRSRRREGRRRRPGRRSAAGRSEAPAGARSSSSIEEATGRPAAHGAGAVAGCAPAVRVSWPANTPIWRVSRPGPRSTVVAPGAPALEHQRHGQAETAARARPGMLGDDDRARPARSGESARPAVCRRKATAGLG